ncbi:ARM repeat-containing protein [Clavulina sp. PMI_390]|nr:ARM repeat-containing protein [Clavulina sp. PMI_390]
MFVLFLYFSIFIRLRFTHPWQLQCYFLQRADASVPIIYFVERVRQGRSFITRNIKASQRGKIVFLMLASFAVIEEGHPESQWPVHFGVKGPEESVDQADILQGFADATDNPQRKQYLLDLKGDRLRSPIEMRQADPGEGPEGLSPVKWWMRARNIPKYEASFQKFLSTTARAIRNNPENEGNTAIAMMASLDHSLWFYDHEFDCRDWLLFVMDSPRVGMGRGVVYGAFYNMAGKLIAATSQEGVTHTVVVNKSASVQAVLQALQVFSGQTNKVAIDTANRWLQDFQHTPEAWITCDYLLNAPDSALPAQTFAAQTIRAKVTFDLQQVAPADRMALKQSLVGVMQRFAAGPRVVLVQTCLSLAGLALQLPDWSDPVGDMISALGQNPLLVPALLQFLTVLPEEVSGNTRIPISNDDYRLRSPQLLTDKSDEVMKLLTLYIQAPGIISTSPLDSRVTSEIQGQIFKGIRSWIACGEVDVTAFAETPLFGFCFDALGSEVLFDDAVDVICDLIHETMEIDDYMPVIERIVARLLPLRPAVSACHEDPDKMRGFCRMFAEAGETYRILIVRHPDTFFPIVDVIAECAAYDDLDIVQITFAFWYRLGQSLEKLSEVPLRFQQLYRGLMDVMVEHLQYPDDMNALTAEERDDFREFRHVMGDTLKDCCIVLGTSVCLKSAYDKAALAVNKPNISWQEIEAPLFSMRSMGAEVNPEDDEVVPLIMDLIPRLPPHPQVRYAATLVISRYTEWVDAHPQYIEFQLQYISSGFESAESEVSAAAGQAMKYLCKDCKKHLVPFLPQLHTFVSSIGQKLAQDDRIQIYEAIAYVITSMPMIEAAQALSQFALEIIGRISFKTGLTSPSADQINQTAEELEEIETMLKVVGSLGEILPPSCQGTIVDTWGVIDKLLQNQGSLRMIAERTCKLLRFALEFFTVNSEPVIPLLLERLASAFDGSAHSSYIWISGKAIRLFGNSVVPEMRSAFRRSFERISQQVFGILKLQRAEDIPDVMEDYVQFLLVMVDHAPDVLYPSPSFPDAFRVAVTALSVYHTEIVLPAVQFIRGVLQDDSLVPGAGPAPPAAFPVYATVIRGVVESQGFGLVGYLLSGLLGTFEEATAFEVVGLFRRLAQLWPQQLLTWTPAALEQLESHILTPTLKNNMVADFNLAVNEGKLDRIKAAVMGLHFAAKRNMDRSRVTAMEYTA